MWCIGLYIWPPYGPIQPLYSCIYCTIKLIKLEVCKALIEGICLQNKTGQGHITTIMSTCKLEGASLIKWPWELPSFGFAKVASIIVDSHNAFINCIYPRNHGFWPQIYTKNMMYTLNIKDPE